MMRPLEEMLKKPEYIRAYNCISEHFNKIIPYVGTGMSFFFRSWGAPFQAILDDLEKSYGNDRFFAKLSKEERERANDALKYELNGESLPVDVICVAQCLELAMREMNVKDDLLEGDKLTSFSMDDDGSGDTIWKKLRGLCERGLYIELGELLHIISVTLSGMSFNKRFFDAVADREKAAKEYHNSELEKVQTLINYNNKQPFPESTWFLPYLGNESNLVFTTNTDITLKLIYSVILGHSPVICSNESNQDDICTNAEGNRVVFHIHGMQNNPNTDTSGSFIMTWSDYRKAYIDQQGSALDMLLDKTQRGHFLFMGSSLESDVTVRRMKRAVRRGRITNRHVAFFGPDNCTNPDERQIALCADMATQSIVFSDFHEYSIALCQIVRENTHTEWKVYKTILSCTGNENDEMFRDFSEKLTIFLDDEEAFKKFDMVISEIDLHDRLFPALKKHIAENERRSFNWAVCHVTHDDFDFPIKKEKDLCLLDTYSAPLGNTIYIIGGRGCTSGRREQLSDDIEKWTNAHENGYWTSSVKVRVILVDVFGDCTPENLIDDLENILSFEDAAVAYEALSVLVSKMREYSTYSHLINYLDTLDRITLSESSVYAWIGLLLANIDGMTLFAHLRFQIKDMQNQAKMKDSLMNGQLEQEKAMSRSLMRPSKQHIGGIV